MMILENIAGVARPVRMTANSSLANSIARSIFSSASKSVSSITFLLLWTELDRSPSLIVTIQDGLRCDECADPLTTQRANDGVLALGAEHEHGQLVVHAQAERRRVDHPQSAAQGVVERDRVELPRGRVGARVGGVDPVDAVLAHEHRVRVDLEGALR